VDIIQGKGYIEVKPSKLKKHKLLKEVLAKASAVAKLDFLLYLGADTGNEPVYAFLRKKRIVDIYFKRENHRYICTLGKKPSLAEYFLDDAEEA
jgi:trehalose-6-phosphatase